MNLQLGFFEDFKLGDTVLLVGSPKDMELLATLLEQFVSSQETSMAIHTLCSLAPRHPAQLFACRSKRGLSRRQDAHFNWLCSAGEYLNISGKLQALAESSHGHHYFDLIRSPAQLVVSVGEYDQNWWKAHG